MRIDEIVGLVSRFEPIEKYEGLLKNAKRTPAFENFEFAEVINSDEHYLGLFKYEELISILHIEIRDFSHHYQITYTQTEPKYQRLGCFRYLLNTALDKHDEILSDDHQTTEAETAWKSLIRFPSGKIQIFVFNPKTNTKTPVKEVSYDKIWNGEEIPILMAKKVTHTQDVMEHIVRDNEIKKKSGRDYDSLWYGVNSSGVDYNNP